MDGEDDLDLGTLTLKRGRAVRVLLRDAVTGVPYNGRLTIDKGATITVAVRYRIRAEGSLNGPPYPDLHRSVPTLDGTLLLEHLPATAFALELEAPLYLPLHMTVGAEEETLMARLEPGARVTGHVRDGQGRPAPAALVFMNTDGTWVDHQTDDTGAFEVRALPPGLYTVIASGSGLSNDLRFPSQSVRIPFRGEVHLAFGALGSGTTVTLRMTEDVHTALLLQGQVPAPGSSKAFDFLTSRQHPQVEWAGLSMRYLRVPAGHYTLLAVNRRRMRSTGRSWTCPPKARCPATCAPCGLRSRPDTRAWAILPRMGERNRKRARGWWLALGALAVAALLTFFLWGSPSPEPTEHHRHRVPPDRCTGGPRHADHDPAESFGSGAHRRASCGTPGGFAASARSPLRGRVLADASEPPCPTVQPDRGGHARRLKDYGSSTGA